MSNDRVYGTSWNINKIKNPKSAKWQFRVPGTDMVNLINGFAPQQMEDRWMSCTKGPDSQGNIVVHFCRSWTSNEIIVLKGRVSPDASRNPRAIEQKGGEILEIVWEPGKKDEYEPMNEERAKELAIGLCKGLLKFELKP
ncbi:atp-dependent dna helicase [Fusarium heterosporum]|uniref:Atp-dependent dna helicase n=1 Tax=Fusarium heterosporum TaxID=42747 RepID=A0A8H5WY78_FUSHE|nr:atp-dependent dna helicase [Fusarium heterosporum]